MSSRRIALGLLAAANLYVGAWAQFAPASFYESFPLGRGWVAADGSFNEHLLRDFGGLNLAVFVVVAVALVRMRPDLVRLAATATLVYGVPHLVYHATALEHYGTADAVAVVLSLVPGVAIGAWLLVSPARRDREAVAAGRGATVGRTQAVGS